MAYQYSSGPQQVPSTSRSTFNAAVGTPAGSQVLFGGLPLDVTEKDIRDLLTNQPLTLSASTTNVRGIFTSAGQSTGQMIVQVGNDVDAERIRREYSGQTIDGTYRLVVQHILPATQPLPPASSVTPMVFPTQPAAAQSASVAPAAGSRQRPQLGKAPVGGRAKSAPAPGAKPANGTDGPAPGLKLLARINKTGAAPGATNKQLALLAQQKANLRGSGQALLSRMAGASSASSKTAAAQKSKIAKAATGAAKVARAKQGNKADKMDVDQPTKAAGAAGGKPKSKSQAELDEEMRLYARQSRFAQPRAQ